MLGRLRFFVFLICALFVMVGHAAHAASEFTVSMYPITSFSFNISAAGTFVIDWGDESAPEIITKTDTEDTTYSHTYEAAGEYSIGISGQATAYNTDTQIAAISFASNSDIARISGSLGAIFGTLSSGDQIQPRFYQTFYDCGSMMGEIPAELFSGIQGAPVESMFESTFERCTELTGEIPAELFSGIRGAPAKDMFASTFAYCTRLSGGVPKNLVAGLEGAAADRMFAYTFSYCYGLTGYVDADIFTIPAGSARNPYYNTFLGTMGMDYKCPENTYTDNKIVVVYLGAVVCRQCPAGTGSPAGSTSVDACGASVNPEFTVTTTTYTTSFSFNISAAGTFAIDWGDGTGIETITKTDTDDTTYSHTYEDAGEYNIGMSGQATRYNTSYDIAAISFENNENISGISGSLGAIFGTLGSGPSKQPRFYETFYSCYNMTGEIPAELFDGISGAPVDYMFAGTFQGCYDLTGAIPQELFSGIQGAPAEAMFYNTFADCWRLSGRIPASLFAGIQGKPAVDMFWGTFRDCYGLTGNVPAGLFRGIRGAPVANMFAQTFLYCGGLTGYVDGSMFPISDDADGAYSDTFAGANNMEYSCPKNTYAVEKPDSSWAVAVRSLCPDTHPLSIGDIYSIDECYVTRTCAGGDYYDIAASACVTCPANSYCAGGAEEIFYNGNRGGGINACPTHSTSPAGSTSRAACVCNDGLAFNSGGACSALCSAGVTTIRTGTGVVVPLFATKNTTPAINIGHNNAVCYADLVRGTTTNAIHVRYNGTVYHTVQ